MLEHWGMQSTPSLPSFPGTSKLGVIAPERILPMGKKELNRGLESLFFCI